MKSLLLGVLLVASPALYAARQEQTEEPEKQTAERTEQKKTPSLVDLARQERERREENTGPVRVIRNEDLQMMRGGRVSTGIPPKPAAGPSEEETSEGEPAAEEEPIVKEGPEDVQFWTNAFQEAKTALETAINQRMVLELRMNNLRNAYLNTDDGTTREKIQSELPQVYQALGQARENEKAAREAIRQLERQAGRVGLTPGQIRDLVGKLPESKSIYEGVPQSEEGAPES